MDYTVGRVMDFFRGRHRDYCQCFSTPAGQAVLRDLAMICGIGQSPGTKDKDGRVDTEATFAAIGRQEVWLHIQKHLRLTSEELYMVATGKTLQERLQESGDA